MKGFLAKIMKKSEQEVRQEKAEQLRAKGINPYPATAKRTHMVSDFILAHEKLTGSANVVSLAGRIMSIRGQGGVNFVHLRDESGEVQLFFKKDELGEELFNQFTELLDRGDFIDASGVAFTTKRGEKSLLVQEYTILTKTILPLPEKWHGLQDVEQRYRKRYLDLIAGDGVMERFKIRSAVLFHMRQFLHNEGYTEVETPVLQPLYGGTSARPFTTHHNSLDINLYLRIASELYLKRLTIGGMEKVYEISRVFRNEGLSPRHNPEFTLFETMAAYEDYTYNMSLIERLYEHCAKQIFGKTQIKHGEHILEMKAPWKRVTMVDAVKEVVGWDYLSYDDDAIEQAKVDAAKMGCADVDGFADTQSLGELLTVLFEEKVEQTLIQPTIVYRYPVESSPLAKACEDDQRFVERFEQYILGQEQGNNYSELNDPEELRRRFESEEAKTKRGKAVDDVHSTDYDFLEAIAHGMPPTSGAGIGVDRMVMVFAGATTIKEVVLFPTMKPKE